LRRNPLFALTATLSLAIGIGANTTIFTIANALLFKPPPVSSSRIAWSTSADRGTARVSTTVPIRTTSTSVRGTPCSQGSTRTASAPRDEPRRRDGAERIYGDMVSTNYFHVLGTRPVVGRPLRA
jgi:hypothetical protein